MEQAENEESRRSRRRLLGQAVGGAGFLALTGSGLLTIRQATAKDDDDDDDNSGHGSGGDDNSGHGHGGDDHDNSGHGGGDDDPVITGEIPPGSIEIRIVDDDANGFTPGELTVDLGQAVTFVNADHHAHTATGSGFDTGVMQPGQTATITLDKPGTFAYACQIHPQMTGKIAVRDENGEVPTPSRSAPTEDATACQITNFAFDPPTLTVPAGTTVAWTNADSVPHTVTAIDGAFDSGIFDPGSSFAWAFNTPGTFRYRCNLHPQMEGVVEVTGDAPASASPEASPGATGATPVASPAPDATALDNLLVTILDFSFDPTTLEVPAGTTVTWVNDGDAPHTATAEDGSFDTGQLDPGQEGSHTFDQSGTYTYACAFHPQMVGAVMVT